MIHIAIHEFISPKLLDKDGKVTKLFDAYSIWILIFFKKVVEVHNIILISQMWN